jgi:RNA polymerase sigma-70 factor (ECF subfamily)
MNKQNYLAQWEKHFISNRPFLIAFSFRMTGSLTEAEDIVQDTYIACADVNPDDVRNHKSWLTKIASNKGLDHLKSAHMKRETYPGVWLPDAVPDSFQFWGNLEAGDSPDKKLLESESLSTSFLLLLQKLTAEERVVYLLSDIFDYSFREISEFLQKSEDACKKIGQHARKAFENQKRFVSYTSETEDLVTKFFASAKIGDADSLDSMLSPDSEFWADGGGKVSVASQAVITDRNRITKFFAGLWSSKVLAGDDVKQEIKYVNSRPGLVVSRRLENGDWQFDTIISFDFEDGKIARIYAQRNPDKLNALLS